MTDTFREAQRLAERFGWRYVRRTKHTFLFRRGQVTTGMSTSPGDRRSWRNFMADLRRKP